MVFGDPAEREAYETLVAAFEEQNPDVDVAITHIPSGSEYRTRLTAEFAAGDPPDVSLMNYRRYAAFAAADLLETTDTLSRKSELINEEDFYPITLAGFRWGDDLLCIPQNISSLVVYYNQDLFDAAGVPYPADDWTWDDFLAAARH